MNIQEALDIAMENLGQYGTDRVVTSARATTVPYAYAGEFGIEVELVFIRDDGWTLGCHRTHQSVAYQMHQDRWIAMIIKPEGEPRLIGDVLAKGDKLVNEILGKMKSFPKRLAKPKPGGLEGVWGYVGTEGPEEIEEA